MSKITPRHLTKEWQDDMKSKDVKHRRGTEKVAACLHDLLCAAYIKIIGSNRTYVVRAINDWGDYVMYEDNNSVGYVTTSVKKQFKISKNVHGLHLTLLIKYSNVTCYGEKLPRN